ncbi:hypothetical protein DPMN_138660 [Dreissena polymorpha]|uniref:Uncharacterized protein n=1 Tax=Dreissena polymorpha TaxID=45954 RepID=A0A9D4G827_DREPO|nr:hypothetical protein DPMN_138660 [Dreissena polymorpha]
MILTSYNEQHSYVPDKLSGQTDRQTDRPTDKYKQADAVVIVPSWHGTITDRAQTIRDNNRQSSNHKSPRVSLSSNHKSPRVSPSSNHKSPRVSPNVGYDGLNPNIMKVHALSMF